MNIYTDARSAIVTALQGAGLTAYGYTPPTLVPPCIIVEPGDGWIEPDRIGGRSYAVTFTATAHVNLIDSATAIDSLEDLVATALPVIPAGVYVTSVEAPAVDGTGSQGETLAAAINLTAQVKE